MPLFNYSKPGPGIQKNSGYEMNRFALYFQLLGRKFWNICILNLVISLFTLPYLVLLGALFYGMGHIPFFGRLDVHLYLVLTLLPFMFYGPVLSAAFKVGRDFAREEPVFIFSDFCRALKQNKGKSILLSFISYFFFVALTYALPTYFMMPGIGIYVFFPLCLIAALALIFVQYYIYTMVSAFELTTKEILKNALIFSFISIGNNILLFLILCILLALSVTFLMLSFSYPILFGLLIILLICFLPAFYIFTISFVTHPALQKYIVEPYYKKNPEKTSAVLQSSVKDTEDQQEIAREIPEYVYHNGRMVHRSVLESESVFEDNHRLGPTEEDKK